MSTKVMELSTLFSQDDLAAQISQQWDKYNQQRRVKIEEWKELRNYIFATDTSTTSNGALPWKNSTTLPKLCQIRDNLHSNYLSALFPNDDWLRWEGYSSDDATLDKAQAIEAYMKNKTRIGHFRTQMSKLLYDYIDYGNAFCTVSYEQRQKMENGEVTPGFIGPLLKRISPLDVVFNPLADSFADTFKIVRSVRTIGEIMKMAEDEPQNQDLMSAVVNRNEVISKLGGYSVEDFDKWEGFSVDGFGNMYEYYTSGYVELLEFYGSMYNEATGKMETDRIITIMDRSKVIRNEPQPSWHGQAAIYHVGWRFRPDNLWAMGPLDNLVGMQYRIDHLENLKADAMDLAIHPPLKIIGEVEEFVWGPGAEIHIDEGGDVQELGKNAQWVLQAQNDIQILEDKMEMYAGAPREAMGVRTPGEKTAFEVQSLQNAAGRIFQEKVNTFETELLEPALNGMLEISRRYMDTADIARVMDDDLGVERFLSVTKEDITASGKLRPVGARHFAARAQLLQNLTQLGNSTIGQTIAPHLSGIRLAKMVEDVLGLGRYELIKPNVAIEEQAETQRMMNQAQEDLTMESAYARGELDGEAPEGAAGQM